MAARKKSEGGLDQSIENFRASLEKSVTVSRERLQEVLDDAVERGRMTRRDAETVVSELLDRGRRQRDSLLDELERLGKQLGRQSEKVARQAREVTEKPLAKAEQKLRKSRARSEAQSTTKPTPNATKKSPASKSPTLKPGKRATSTARSGASSSTPFPIADYDSLTAAEVRKSLADLSASQLKAVREREAAGSARKTVLAAIDKKLETAEGGAGA